jgi:AraC family transcriptional regulator of adaptative response/methylated-DNA-[protein]-cysteine methyltransferase
MKRAVKPKASTSSNASLMADLAKYIDKHAGEALSLDKLAAQAQLSPAHLQRVFKAALGVSPKAYHDAARMRLLKRALKSGKGVLESITEAGFQSTSRVYGHATRTLGMTPSSYRSGGSGEAIAYAFRVTALGPLMMAATDRGVCFAQFGRSEQSLVEQLQAEFPKATVRESDATHSAALDAWMQAFEGDIVSYTEVATGIGAPSAVRAAAGACAANRIAVLVPCHRVLRGDGGMGGYRWGIERKRVLIDRERARRAS